jgi:hypothetical protein
MVYQCPICKEDPTSHSLQKRRETEDCVYFYTCPAQASKYNDTEGILSHYRGVLGEIPEGKEWVWVFDASGFSMKHAMEFTLATQMARLVTEEFGENLRKVYVVRPTTFITITMNVIWPFLSERIRQLITIRYED